MTSIEWLIEQIKEYDFTPPSNNEEYVIVMPKWIFDTKKDESLEMHKQEIIDAWKDGAYGGGQFTTTHETSEQYYQETFVSKGSDDIPMERKLLKSGFVDIVPKKENHIVESNEMITDVREEINLNCL